MARLGQLVTSEEPAFELAESYRSCHLQLVVETNRFDSLDSCYVWYGCPFGAICSSPRRPGILLVDPYLSGHIHQILGVIEYLSGPLEIAFIDQLPIHYLVLDRFGPHVGLHSKI